MSDRTPQAITARPSDLAAIAAYGAFAQSSADRLGEMPPWAAIPPEARADWRAVADAVQMVSTPHLAEDGWDAARDRITEANEAVRAERERLASVETRGALGALVREVWVRWASEQPDPKPSWLVPWEELDPGQREVDMRIGATLAAVARIRERERCAELAENYQCPCGDDDCDGADTLRSLADLLREQP